MQRYVKPYLFILGIILVSVQLSACLPLTEQTFTFRPVSLAGIMDTKVKNFGVCSPFELDRRGASFFIWTEFLRARDSRYANPSFLSGYEILVNRGESCHLITANRFQTAVAFDISSLPSSAVTSAELRITGTADGGTDRSHARLPVWQWHLV